MIHNIERNRSFLAKTIKRKAIALVHTCYKPSVRPAVTIARSAEILHTFAFYNSHKVRNCAAQSLLSRIIVARRTDRGIFSSSNPLIPLREGYAARDAHDDYGGPICSVKSGSNLAVTEILVKIVKSLSELHNWTHFA